MEASEGEAVFDAFDLNPQLFLNEVLNAVDDMVDGAFDFCIQQAPQITGGGSERSEELARGISSLHEKTRAILDKRMSMWEKYCLQHCFSVPDGFALPKSKESSISMLQEVLLNDELNDQLVSLREKLTAARNKSEELQREISLLEKQSTVHNNCTASVAEVQHIFEKNRAHQMFQELAESTSKLHQKVADVKKQSVDMRQQESLGKMHSLSSENKMIPDKGLSATLVDIEELVGIIRNT